MVRRWFESARESRSDGLLPARTTRCLGSWRLVFCGVLGAVATPIGNGAIVVASIISNVVTAPVFALAVSVMFFDLGGGRVAEVPAASSEPPAPTAPAA